MREKNKKLAQGGGEVQTRVKSQAWTKWAEQGKGSLRRKKRKRGVPKGRAWGVTGKGQDWVEGRGTHGR